MLTIKEEELINELSRIWNKFLELPEEHLSDNQEFCAIIHQAQRMIECRPVRRYMRMRDAH